MKNLRLNKRPLQQFRMVLHNSLQQFLTSDFSSFNSLFCWVTGYFPVLEN